MMRVEECMIPSPMVVSKRESVEQITAMIFHHKISQLPVVDERDRLVGIITERDVLEGVQARGSAHLVAEDVMTANPESVTPGCSILEAVDILVRKRYGALPVVMGERVVGLLVAHDLLRDLVRSHEMSMTEPASPDRAGRVHIEGRSVNHGRFVESS